MMNICIDFKPLGDRGIRVGFSDKISPEVNRIIRSFVYALEREAISGVIEIVPTYTAIGVYYDPGYICYREMIEQLSKVKNKLQEVKLPPARLIEIPVLYGGDVGPDLEYVAKFHNLTTAEVIKLHSSVQYLVYMLGFSPGFPYLGGLPDEIATPRLKNPRPKILGGSVGIGGNQTGIYPADAPGGWQIIGHTPVKLYDPQKEEAVLLNAGDYLQFEPVDEDEYYSIKKSVDQGEYRVKINHLSE